MKQRGGCPHVPKDLAMKLIEEIEEKVTSEEGEDLHEVKKAEEKRMQEERWLQDFVECHPVLKKLPEKLKKKLVVKIPEKVGKIPGVNRRAKKRWYQKGLIVHLYLGEPSGFNLEKALKEQGGDEKRLLEIDIKKGAEFDMVEDPMYASLLRLSLDDTIEAVVCGPNCRTRSVLRHFPIPDQPDAPKLVRGWGGEECGLRSNSDEERKKVEDDDLMLRRAITVSLISIHNRRAAQPEAPEPKFLIEQSSSPKNFPEVVAFWRTEEWRRLCEIYGWKETHFNQGDWGGKTSKPTTVGGSVKIQVPTAKKSRGGEAVRSSKELERWSPGMMREVARWLVEDVPFRRDCKICQESRQKQHPHRKVKQGLCGVLSLDRS